MLHTSFLSDFPNRLGLFLSRYLGYPSHCFRVIYPSLKGISDRLLALTSLFLLIPLLVLVSILVRCSLGAPVFFRQLRPGLGGKPFHLLKFRTMSNQLDFFGVLLPDEQRVTPFGRWLRSTSIDELPSLINILRGEMSFIGPRPLLMEYLPLYTLDQARRHKVLPGLSGWSQINGRNLLSWEEKLRLDIWYVDNYGFALDLRILLATVIKVILRECINSSSESATVPFGRPSSSARVY